MNLNKWKLKRHSCMRARILLPLSLAMIIVSSSVPVFAFHNLLQNPGFESGDFPPWWWDSDGNASAAIGGSGHTGDWSAWLQAGDGEVGLMQNIDPPRCAMYLEFWYRDYVEGTFQIIVSYSDDTSYCLNIDEAAEWTLFHMDLNTTKLVKKIEIYLSAPLGYADVDDFDLEACEKLPEPALGGELNPGIITSNISWLITGISAITVTIGIAFKKRKSF